MSAPTLVEIENAFQPAREINDAERFAGRGVAVQESYLGVVSEGSNIAIVGNRGIGKTSLARQIGRIASGDNSLLEKLGIPFHGKLDFLVVYFACGNAVSSITDLLERLLTAQNCLGDWIYDIPKAKKEVDALKPKLGVSAFGLRAGVDGEMREEAEMEPAIRVHSVDTVFTNVLIALSEQKVAKHGVLIIIDEFDQIRDPGGFAPMLKSLATNAPQVKFCIVGVAQDIQNLMKEHKSADRLFAGSVIILPFMTEGELEEIIDIAEQSINGFIRFTPNARARLVSLAQGHPYMVHLIGKYALRSAYQSNRREIDDHHIDETLKTIAERGADPILEGRYKKAVGSSMHREIVLKSLAEIMPTSADGEVWTRNAYKLALDQGVDNSSQYVGQLVTDDYGAEIEKVRDRYYRFKDSLFAAYVRARPRLIEGQTTTEQEAMRLL